MCEDLGGSGVMVVVEEPIPAELTLYTWSAISGVETPQ